MITDANLLSRLSLFQKTLFSSLRLKDVLENASMQFSDLARGAKVAIFLADNDCLSLKLMNVRGYQEGSSEELRVLSFTAESILKQVIQKRQGFAITSAADAPDISAAIMRRESSAGQIGLPLIASNLLVGAILIDVTDTAALKLLDVYKDCADLAAIAVANAILFGRSEYERERLGTLYKTSVALSGSSLKVAEVLQITADTSLILGNTPHCALLMYDAGKQCFHVAAFKGLDGNSLHDFDLSAEDTLAGRALTAGKAEYVSDAMRYQHCMPRSTAGGTFGSALAVPIVFNNTALAVLMLFSTEIRGFHREQIELLESLAQQTANALNVALTHEEAAAQTIQDAHTGLYNRWHFDDCLSKEVERSARHKRETALLILDIDHLSRVNSMLGVQKGDEAIRHVAKLIKSALRDIDIACRFGAEEFAVILPETGPGSALEVAERLRQKIRSQAAPGIGMVTVSVGLAAFPSNADSVNDLLKTAEQALDVAKFEGRDRIKVTEANANVSGPIAWHELARQAKLAVVNERQSKLQNRTGPPEYAPWMRATPGWGAKKRPD